MSSNSWVGFVSGRFIRRDRTKTVLIIAIAISVATLISVLSIMNGLQFITINNLIQIESYHLIIQESLTAEQRTAIHAALAEESRLDSVVSFAELQTIAHSDSSDLNGVSIRAVDQEQARQDRQFIEALNIVRGAFDLSDNRILIGTSLANALRVNVGDELQIYGHSGQTHRFLIGGLFHSGYATFDNGLVVMAIDRARESINRSIPIHIGIKYRDITEEERLIPTIDRHVTEIVGRQATLVDWQRSNAAIFSALKLEKIFIIFTLGMIFIIVAINIRQSLARKARQYAGELAILKAMGGVPHRVQFIIAYMGLYIGIIGGVFGVLIGLWLALNINNLFIIADAIVNGVIRLTNSALLLLNINALSPISRISSAFFFIDIVEHRLLLRECVIIFLFAVAISFGAAYIASRKSAIARPIQTLHSVNQ